MAEEAFCHVCYGTSLTFENGVLVCETCGMQTQTYQEEAEFQEGIDDTRGRRRAAGSSTTAAAQSQAAILAREEQVAAQQLQDAAMVYVRCLQLLLRVQGEVLTSKYGVSPQISSLLRQLWLAHIPTTGILEPRPHRPAATAAQALAQGADGGGADAMDVDGQQGQQRAATLALPHNMKRLFWKLLHPQVTLQLCFLGCVLLREAVTFYDVMSWALDGQLPFMDLPGIISAHMSEAQLVPLAPRCIQPLLSSTPLAFANRCVYLADALGLELPPVPGEALLLRGVTEMALPLVVYDVAVQLYFLYLIDTPKMHFVPLTRAAQVAPYVWLAAAVLVALKLLYGLGNAVGQVTLVAKAAGPPQGWQAWSEQLLQRVPGITNMPLSAEEALSLGPRALQQYLQYCRTHAFAGQPCVPSFEDIQRLLLGWFDAATNAHAAAAATATQQQRRRHAAAATGDNSSSQPPQGQQQQQQLGGRPASNIPGGGGNSITLDPGDPATHPPGCSSYNIAMVGMAGAALGVYRLEPRLAAVAVAVAAYARVPPVTLMECVRTLEKSMVSVEAGVRILHRMQQHAAAA